MDWVKMALQCVYLACAEQLSLEQHQQAVEMIGLGEQGDLEKLDWTEATLTAPGLEVSQGQPHEGMIQGEMGVPSV